MIKRPRWLDAKIAKELQDTAGNPSETSQDVAVSDGRGVGRPAAKALEQTGHHRVLQKLDSDHNLTMVADHAKDTSGDAQAQEASPLDHWVLVPMIIGDKGPAVSVESWRIRKTAVFEERQSMLEKQKAEQAKKEEARRLQEKKEQDK